MNTNEKIRTNALDDIIILGVASIETKGPVGPNEGGGDGLPILPGISEE
ncbi:benenodin family lasso peptide [Pseudoxanthomonas yeongjuensis]|nr:benenodin family lasso peptide [Pseudoxanthomonas yeongjuensis]